MWPEVYSIFRPGACQRLEEGGLNRQGDMVDIFVPCRKASSAVNRYDITVSGGLYASGAFSLR